VCTTVPREPCTTVAAFDVCGDAITTSNSIKTKGKLFIVLVKHRK
jgi:hypothetical protein